MKQLTKFLLAAALYCCAQPTFAQLQNINMQLRATKSFPGQTLANICGYWQNGQEYALLGGSNGMIIVDITNPASPQQIVQIPSPEGTPNNGSLWKEIKVYKQYAYLVTEAGGGIQIIDMSALPSPNLPHHLYTGDGDAAGEMDEIHALHIDVTKGYLYTYGGNWAPGGAKVFDLNQDPYNPKYVGRFEQLGYIHDGYVDNDTLYACHINAGIMSVVDMTDKGSPEVLGTVETPGKFTHNSWITSDRKHVLTTDETVPSFLTSYDVSNPDDIKELDRLSPNNGVGTYVHNTHIINDYAVTSWYTSGVLIVDAHRPQNLITVAQYDTYAGNNLEFEGCWGAFPFFPSGTIVTSDIEPGELTVLTPTYKRACYFEGKIINGCNGAPLAGATVKINGSTDPQKIVTTRVDGIFRTGQVTPGNFTATVSAPGFPDKTVNITLTAGQVFNLDITLDAGQVFNVNGSVVDASNGSPISGVEVVLTSPLNQYTITTNGIGQFNATCLPVGNYTATAGKWGYLVNTVNVSPGVPVNLQLTPGYYDDFATDLGWTVSGTAAAGEWELGEPEGTFNQNNLVNPEFDADQDNNDQCYMTANGGGQPGSNDVDNGFVSLISPVMKLAGFQDAVMTFYYWFYNATTLGNAPNDLMEVNILKGAQTINVLTLDPSDSQSAWQYSGDIHLKDFAAPLTDNIRIEFKVNDLSPGNWLEGALDIFKVVPVATVGTNTLDASASMLVLPNPSGSEFHMQYAWENATEMPKLVIQNLLGQTVYEAQLNAKSDVASFGQEFKPGVYFASMVSGGQRTATVKLVKQ
ncbi:MAG TPA: choice-of-anchor B family protein [Saprospiraceae bacterium]|nr:choice-of-anchor B family protein [Saprospiraceae bacterium]